MDPVAPCERSPPAQVHKYALSPSSARAHLPPCSSAPSNWESTPRLCKKQTRSAARDTSRTKVNPAARPSARVPYSFISLCHLHADMPLLSLCLRTTRYVTRASVNGTTPHLINLFTIHPTALPRGLPPQPSL